MISAAFASVWHMRVQALRDASQNLAMKGVALSEHTDRAVQAVDLVLQELHAQVSKLAADGPLGDSTVLHGQPLQERLRNSLINLPQLDVLSVIDRDGRLIVFSRGWPTPAIDLSDRDYFRWLRDHDDRSAFVSAPVRNRGTEQWVFYLARRVNGPDGRFAGLTIAALPLSYFTDFYTAVTDGAKGGVALRRMDGVLLARFPNVSALMGNNSTLSPHWPAIVAAGGGSYAAPRSLAGDTRLVSVHPLRLYPLVVDVWLMEAAALGDWRSTAWLVAVGTGFAAIGFILLFSLLSRQFAAMHRQHRELAATALALARSEQQMQAIARDLETTLGAMDEGLMMINDAERVMICNARAIELLGLPAEMMAAQPTFADVLRFQWEQNEFVATPAELQELIRTGPLTGIPRVYERRRPDGRILEVRNTPLAAGGAVRTYIDITERRNAEAMRAARDEADRASRAKSEFLATMSHEIRSPMSGLLGVLDLLRATNLDADQSRMAAMVHNSGMMLLAVLNDILDFSKIEAGAMTIAPEPVALRPLLDDLVQPQAITARHKGVGMMLSVDAAVPDRVMTDGLRLRQIIGNMLSNALKFTAAGEITVRVALVADGEPPMLRFAVRDTGIGMSEEVLAKLFNPFTQADGSTTRRFGGTGLGLSISRKLAQLLGGDIRVSSREGEGSEFVLMLPSAPCADAAEAPALREDAASALLADGRRVLVVDDDPTIRWLSQRLLEKLGCRVEAAEDGVAGLAKLQAGGYDLLLTDCHMPRMDGVALTRAVRASEAAGLRDLPIIGLTADVTEAQSALCHEAGMTALAIKPLPLERLAALLRTHLPGVAGNAPAPTAEPAAPALRAVAFDTEITLATFPPGDPDGMAWLQGYLDGAREDAELLAGLLDAPPDDLPRDAIAKTAHRLAGASFSVGAMLLGEAARTLERAAPSDDPATLEALHAALRQELAEAEAAILRFLQDAAATAA